MIPIRGLRAPITPPPPAPINVEPEVALVEARRPLWPSWYHPPTSGRLIGTELLRSVANDFGLTVAELKGQGRHKLLVDARAVVMRVLRKRGLSYPQIARALGRSDHSTAIHSVERFDRYAKRNPLVRESYERHRAMDERA